MATAVHIPVDEYLRTSYQPDCDYIDGEVRERHLGTRPHAALQIILATIFNANRKAWGVYSFAELRTRVSATRYRIPDVVVVAASDPATPVVQTTPLICIEVISPDDTMRDMQERADDYRAMGVKHIWVFDPVRKRTWTDVEGNLEEVNARELRMEGRPIRIDLDAVFAELDEFTGGTAD